MDERELVHKSKTGDEAAFAELFTLYRPRIYRLSVSIVKEPEVAEDVVQETFLQAYTHLKEFREESSFYTWIYRIAHNLSINKSKKKHEEPLVEEAISKATFDDLLEKKEFEKALEEGLATLSPKHRVVFELYDLQKHSQKEIAALLGVPPGTIRSRLHYARKKMRKYLRPDLFQ